MGRAHLEERPPPRPPTQPPETSFPGWRGRRSRMCRRYVSLPHTHPHVPPPPFFFPSFRSRRRVPSGSHRPVNGTSGRRGAPSRLRPPLRAAATPASRGHGSEPCVRRGERAHPAAILGPRCGLCGARGLPVPPRRRAAGRSGGHRSAAERSGAARGSLPACGAGSTGS